MRWGYYGLLASVELKTCGSKVSRETRWQSTSSLRVDFQEFVQILRHLEVLLACWVVTFFCSCFFLEVWPRATGASDEFRKLDATLRSQWSLGAEQLLRRQLWRYDVSYGAREAVNQVATSASQSTLADAISTDLNRSQSFFLVRYCWWIKMTCCQSTSKYLPSEL